LHLVGYFNWVNHILLYTFLKIFTQFQHLEHCLYTNVVWRSQFYRHRKEILLPKFANGNFVWFLVSYAVKPVHWQNIATGIATHNLLYTNRLISCMYLYFCMKRRCALWNSAFEQQVVPRDFLNHAHNCQRISKQQDTERHLHVCGIDINVWVDYLRDIFTFLLI